MLEAKRRVARTLSKRDAEVTLPTIDCSQNVGLLAQAGEGDVQLA